MGIDGFVMVMDDSPQRHNGHEDFLVKGNMVVRVVRVDGVGAIKKFQVLVYEMAF